MDTQRFGMLSSFDIHYTEYQEDPVGFCKDVLGVGLWGMQKTILESLVYNNKIAVQSCYCSGKTFLASCALLWYNNCFLNSDPLFFAPTNRILNEILFGEMREIAYNSIEPVVIPNTGYSGITEPMYFDGHKKPGLVVFDEGFGCCGIYGRLNELGLVDGGSRVLVIGSPYCSSLNMKNDSLWSTTIYDVDFMWYSISVFDTPNFTDFGIKEDDLLSGYWRAKTCGRKYPYPMLCNPEQVFRLFAGVNRDDDMYRRIVLGRC